MIILIINTMVYIIVLKTPGTVHLYNSFLLEEIHTLYLQLIFPHGDFFMIRRRGGGYFPPPHCTHYDNFFMEVL